MKRGHGRKAAAGVGAGAAAVEVEVADVAANGAAGAASRTVSRRSALWPGASSRNKFARVQHPPRVDRLLERAMQSPKLRRGGQRPPAFFRQADAVLARDGAIQRQHFAKQIIQRGLASLGGVGL